jgi:hypothetical protein
MCQGKMVIVVALTSALACPLKLLLKLKLNGINFSRDSFIFRYFNGRLVAKTTKYIPYDIAKICSIYEISIALFW